MARTPYRSALSGAVRTHGSSSCTTSTPVAFSDHFTANTTTFIGLSPATTYYVRVRAENGQFFLTDFSATA